jgi:acetoin utilization protein AcuB
MRGLVVATYMTRMPFTVGRAESLSVAHREMRAHGIRHLPVVDGDALVGMVSLRDLHLIETLRDVDPEAVKVEEAMTAEPYTVRPDSPLGEVVEEMIGRRFGSAVVVDEGKVVGVFTTRDALRALLAVLRERPRRAPAKGPRAPPTKR